MPRKTWVLLLAITFLLLVLGAAAFFLLRTPEETVNAKDLANLAASNLASAKEKYLYRWARLKGVVRLNLPVEMEGEPFVMVELEAPGKVDVQAAFAGPGPVALEPGDEAEIEGYCQLCEEKVVYFENCRLISVTKKAR